MDLTVRCIQLFICFILTTSYSSTTNAKLSTSSSNMPHSRQKRILWVTEDGRLALPPGTTLVITPSLSLPFVRYPPDGFFSNMTIALPFTIDFNKLGLTDNQNPYGVIPPVLARSMGRATGNLLGNYIEKLFTSRKKRDTASMNILAPELRHAFHGGERAILYLLIEDFLSNFGMDGKACLLRAICEINAHPMQNFGLIGEILKLFFSVSKSPYSDFLTEYVEAEQAGGGSDNKAPGECWKYLKACPKSLFKNPHNLYSKEANEQFTEESKETNYIEDTVSENDSSVSPNVMLKSKKVT